MGARKQVLTRITKPGHARKGAPWLVLFGGARMISRRSSLIVAAAILLCAAAAFAYFGQVLNSFRAPAIAGKTTTCRGVAWDGQYLWLNCAYSPNGPYKVYRCTYRGGSVVSSFNCPFNDPEVSGVSHGIGWSMYGGQGGLDFTVYSPGGVSLLYRLTYTGSIVRSVWVQALVPPMYPSSVDYDGTYYWVSHAGVNGPFSKVYKISSAGVCISSFQGPYNTNTLSGIARDGNNLWLTYNRGLDVVKVNTTGSVLATFRKPGDYLYDCAYANGRLWVVADSQYICEISASTYPGIVPASLGRVKASYR